VSGANTPCRVLRIRSIPHAPATLDERSETPPYPLSTAQRRLTHWAVGARISRLVRVLDAHTILLECASLTLEGDGLVDGSREAKRVSRANKMILWNLLSDPDLSARMRSSLRSTSAIGRWHCAESASLRLARRGGRFGARSPGVRPVVHAWIYARSPARVRGHGLRRNLGRLSDGRSYG